MVEVIPVSARIIVLDVVIYGCSLRIVNCYAPTEDDSDSAKNIFYQSLNKQLNTTGIQKKLYAWATLMQQHPQHGTTLH